MKPNPSRAVSMVVSATLLRVIVASASEPSAGDRLFTLKIQPLFSEKCNGCHGDDPDKIKGGYDMLTRETLLAGGETFGRETVVPGEAAKSFLVEAIRWSDPDFEMPPKESDRLDEEQITLVEEWINAGAPWPDEATQLAIREAEAEKTVTEDGMIVRTSGGLGDEWTHRRYQPEAIWSFLPYEKPDVPSRPSESPGNPIDAFLQAKLDESGIEPATQADPSTLIRRVTYDLTGLPPTPSDIAGFQEEWKRDPEVAWTNLVDRLLDSPHYGERQAQHWFDVARYADTGGMSNDYERSNMWRYRDYVIRAFNEDLPYDRFAIEQLAGDELADASLKGRLADAEAFRKAREAGDYTDEEAEQILATGFLRMGPWDPAMVKKPEARQMYLDDVVNAVGQTFLSTTMRCVKCHDHKFDPIPTRDYYRMYAVFAGTQMAERPVPFLPGENRDGFEADRAMTRELLAFAVEKKNALVEKRENAAREWFQQNGLPYVDEQERRDLPDEKKPPRHVGLTTEEQGRLKVREQDEWIWERRLERYEPLAQAVYNGPDPNFLNARKLRMPAKVGAGPGEANHILLGGALTAPGDEVSPGVLSALGVPVEGAAENANLDPYRIADDLEGRRLAFAKWVVDPANPLTARSLVNRLWQQHFVHPIAGNPNNFGASGRRPTHPELLDWLAADLVEHGWNLKRLHRLIVTSDAYRRASRHPYREALDARDPDNHLLAYYPVRRLSAEEMRDSLLAFTGELDVTMGGLPIRPEINQEVALQPRMIQFSLAPAYQPNPEPTLRHRRTVYAYRVRGLADPFLELFNQPNPNDSCEMRDSAAVSPQAFTLLNSDTITDRSIALAARLENSVKGGASDRIDTAFRQVFGRPADDEESERLAIYFEDMKAYHSGQSPQPRQYPDRITRSLVEEFSGDTFDYEEILPAFRGYEADLQAAEVGPETRALADVCLLLFNANEFAYLY